MSQPFGKEIFVAVFGVLLGFALQVDKEKKDAEPSLQFHALYENRGYVDVVAQSKCTTTFLVHEPRFRVLTHLTPGNCGAMVSPDKVVLPPIEHLKTGTWYILKNMVHLKVDGHEGEVFRIKIVDPQHAGARYEIEVKIPYGDRDNPKWLNVPRFEIEAVSQ